MTRSCWPVTRLTISGKSCAATERDNSHDCWMHHFKRGGRISSRQCRKGN
jgi:hypothetical protein